jgi:hypothetical protein
MAGPPRWLTRLSGWSDPAGGAFVRDGRYMPNALTNHSTFFSVRQVLVVLRKSRAVIFRKCPAFSQTAQLKIHTGYTQYYWPFDMLVSVFGQHSREKIRKN